MPGMQWWLTARAGPGRLAVEDHKLLYSNNFMKSLRWQLDELRRSCRVGSRTGGAGWSRL